MGEPGAHITGNSIEVVEKEPQSFVKLKSHYLGTLHISTIDRPE
jgi:hypothetical protein